MEMVAVRVTSRQRICLLRALVDRLLGRDPLGAGSGGCWIR